MAEDEIKMEPDERYERLSMDRQSDQHHREAENAAELMNILRPKVELNDVPELDTSMGT